jgi:hypothetical protein
MGTGNAEATTMREAIGMDLKEIIALREAAWGSLSSPIFEHLAGTSTKRPQPFAKLFATPSLLPGSLLSPRQVKQSQSHWREISPKPSPPGITCLARFSPTRSIYAM